jgi:hypothetical protein
MSEYKENLDTFEEAAEQEAQPQDTATMGGDGGEPNPIDDDIVTAVLLIKNRQGAVLPVTQLDNLKMDRQANAHEVLRMCADVQDQISAVRVVGELAQIFQHISKDSLKQVASLLSVKVDQNLGDPR